MEKMFGIGFIIALVLGLGGFGFYKHMVNQADKDRAAIQERSFNEGVRKGQVDMAKATNDALIEEVRRIAAAQAETNAKISSIRLQARADQQQIDRYDVSIGETRPTEVEAWANKTTTDLFAGITKEAK